MLICFFGAKKDKKAYKSISLQAFGDKELVRNYTYLTLSRELFLHLLCFFLSKCLTIKQKCLPLHGQKLKTKTIDNIMNRFFSTYFYFYFYFSKQ